MERMLHRGAYERVGEKVGEVRVSVPNRPRGLWARAIGIDENFTRGDKWIAVSLLLWGVFWFAIFAVGTAWNLLDPWPVETWKTFWHVVGIGIPVVMSLVTAVWFTWGGARDIFRLFQHLKAQVVNELDDGTVVGHQNLDEAVATRTGGDKHPD